MPKYNRVHNVLLAFAWWAIITTSAAAGDKVRIEAVAGTPFGVGRVVVPSPTYMSSEHLDTRFISVSDSQGRVLYPSIRYTQPLGLIREFLQVPHDGAPSQLHFHFLFTGAEPIELTLYTPEPRTLTVIPNGRPAAYTRLMRAWWVRYKAAARKQRQEADYVPLVETYLTSMLSRRLGLANITSTATYNTGESLSMLLGTEKLQLAMMQEAVNGRLSRDEALDQPVPQEIDWPEAMIPKVEDAETSVEEIARHVPHECFYVRFSQFANYLWLRRLLEEYGGDLSRMVMLRGTDSQLNHRVENQLGLRESNLSRILGPQVISDVAMLGRDTFLRDGAAIGILFEAKNDLLATELEGQRSRRVKELADEDATVREVMIEGKQVSFASTPDHRLRSFYVQDGSYHLVTNCREIARRFLQCGRGDRTLADSEEFRYARSLVPLGEENTIFVYLSRKFFEGLLSPQYQIEMSRRLKSVTDFELMELATLAAVAEGYGDEPVTMDRLVRLGFLGARVDRRADGSETTIVDKKAIDSRRGARGTFLPIPDTAIDSITLSEANRFRKTAEFHRRRWKQMDPVLVGLRRTAHDAQTEHVQVEARMLPLNKDKYGIITEFFGPPSDVQIQPLEDDIVSVQAFVDGGELAIAPHHLYFGIRDAAPRDEYSERRFLKSLQVLKTAPAYLAAWPSPRLLERIGLSGKPIGGGYQKMLLGLYRLDMPNDFSLLSFDQQILSEVAPRMAAEQVAEKAQLRIHVGDVKNSKFGKWANDLDFQRAWETSAGNVHFLHLITQQLRVPMPQAKQVAEGILDAELICPLGGEYELVSNADGTQRWLSSVWRDGKSTARNDYVSPLTTWLRGLEAAVTIEDERIVARGSLDIQRAKKGEGGMKLPLFDIFGRGRKTHNSAEPRPKSKPAQPEQLPPPEPAPDSN